jgi:hypothetical protein
MPTIVKLKGCRRCGGDIFLERDIEGSYLYCLQCSAVYFKRPALPYKQMRTRRSVTVSSQ